MKTLYSARASVHGGRQGHVESPDGVLDLDLSMPEAMGGPGGSGTNPEQLFAAGYSACFENALRRVGDRKRTFGTPRSRPSSASAVTATASASRLS